MFLNFIFHLASMFQVRPKAGEAKFGEWPHVCAVLKTEIIGGVTVYSVLMTCVNSFI